MPELRDALREATNKLGVLAGNPQLIAFDAMLTSYPTLTVAGAIGFGVNPANAFAGASATIEVIANGANVPTFTGITATGSYVNTAGAVNRIEFECLPSGPGSALAFYAKIGNGGGAAPVTSVAGKTGAVILDKGDVGLGAVDNTADADKPISSATASALNSRESTAARALTPTGTDPGNSATINGFLSWLISAARSAQTTLSELGSLAFKSTISSADITDGTIVDADISPSAAIAISKVSGLQTAINSKQPTDPTLQSIADSTATGLIQRNANETVTLLPTGAMAAPLLAASDAAAVRGVAGLGTMAVQNADAVNITGGVAQGLTIAESDLFLNDSGIAIMRMTGDFYGGCELRLENRNASNGAVFRNLNIPLVDFRFEAAGAVQTIQMRSEFRPSLIWDGSAAEVQFFTDGDAINNRICSFGGNRVNAYKPFYAPSISINNAPAITWHNSAIVPANGAVQDYTLTGLALNDFCQCSTGKDARAVDIGGGVIRLQTDTTGFTGNIKIFAMRTN